MQYPVNFGIFEFQVSQVLPVELEVHEQDGCEPQNGYKRIEKLCKKVHWEDALELVGKR